MISEHVLDSIDFMFMASKSIFCIYRKNLNMTTNIYIMFARTETLWFLYRSSSKRGIPSKTSVHIVVFITAGYHAKFMLLRIQLVRYQVKGIQRIQIHKISKYFED